MSDVTSSTLVQSRRDFLQTAAAASAAGSLLLSPGLSPRVHAGGDDGIKVALIGCGNRGTGAASQALATKYNVKLWAMADAFADRLEGSLKALSSGKAGKYGVEKGAGFGAAIDVPKDRQFIGLDAFQKAIDCGVDVAILTGPPGFRPQHFDYAINAGKHVFMEKPVAAGPAGVRKILEVADRARKKNLKVGVGLQRHHDPSYLEAVQRIQRGDIGKLITLRAYWDGGPPAKVAIPKNNMTELEYQIRNWYFFDWLSGDHIVEQHIHNIDACNWVMGGHPVTAMGMGGRQVRTGKEYGNIFDHHAVEFTYADGTKMFSQCRQIPGCKNQVAEFVEGTNGSAYLNQGRCTLTRGEETLWAPPRRRPGEAENPYQIEHDVLFAAIANGSEHNEADYAASSTMTAIMGRFATYSGKEVKWDEALASNSVPMADALAFDTPAPIQPLPEGGYAIPIPGVTKPF
jgi:predicted dehydrogenase